MVKYHWLPVGLFSPHMHVPFHLPLHLEDPWRLVPNFEGPLEAMPSSLDPTSVSEWSFLEYVDSPYPSVLKWRTIVNASDPSNLVPSRAQRSPPQSQLFLSNKWSISTCPSRSKWPSYPKVSTAPMKNVVLASIWYLVSQDQVNSTSSCPLQTRKRLIIHHASHITWSSNKLGINTYIVNLKPNSGTM